MNSTFSGSSMPRKTREAKGSVPRMIALGEGKEEKAKSVRQVFGVQCSGSALRACSLFLVLGSWLRGAGGKAVTLGSAQFSDTECGKRKLKAET